MNNIWVKRPGTGEIKAKHFEEIIKAKAKRNIKINQQLRWEDID